MGGKFWANNDPHFSGQIIATSAEVTPNGGLVRESPQNPLNSGLGIIVICPDFSQVIDHTVDGLEIRPANLMRLVVYPHDLQFFFYTSQVVSGDRRNSEPSTVCQTC